MSNNQQEDSLPSHRLKSGTPDNILASLFHRILFELGIDTERFNQLMARYIVNARIPVNVQEASTAKGNLRKELMGDKMTWKTFIKGLRFLNISKFEIVIRAHHRNGTVSEHSESVVLRVEENVREEEKGKK